MTADKRFFQLVFTPFISSAISGDIDPRKNHELMLQRMKEMPDKLRNDLIAGLKAEIKVAAIKQRNLPSDIRTLYARKIEAIGTLLADLGELE
jgi:hypothetical protein